MSDENDFILNTDVTNGLVEEIDGMDLAATYRAVTGVLSSHPDSRDVHIDQLAITFHGAEILTDTRLELNTGRRYGLIGLNGCGKCEVSTSTPTTGIIACISKYIYGRVGNYRRPRRPLPSMPFNWPRCP